MVCVYVCMVLSFPRNAMISIKNFVVLCDNRKHLLDLKKKIFSQVLFLKIENRN